MIPDDFSYENHELLTCLEVAIETASRAHLPDKKRQREHKFQQSLPELVIYRAQNTAYKISFFVFLVFKVWFFRGF